MKKIIQEYFSFSKRDRNGIGVLLILILILLAIPQVSFLFLTEEKVDFSEMQSDIQRFKEVATVPSYDRNSWSEVLRENEEVKVETFDFNPNELTYEQGRALGLSHKIARRITNYLKSGRRFYKKEDLKQIYDFSDEDYKRLAPFAIFDAHSEAELKEKVASKEDSIGEKASNDWRKKEKKRFSSNKKVPKSVDDFELRLEIFDPNQLNYEGARHLGMSHQAAKALTNLVKKSRGGKPFKEKEDIKMVYGFTEDDYARLEEYIKIEGDELVLMSDNRRGDEEKKERPATFQFEEEAPILIDINQATVEDWKKLKGIGNAFSNRIVKYRNLLGGFTHSEQLKEVYGLDAILYVEIMGFLTNDHPELIQKININTADEFALKKHPYIDEKLAKAIVKKRIKKGDFQNISELKKIGGMDNALLQQLTPYLTVR